MGIVSQFDQRPHSHGLMEDPSTTAPAPGWPQAHIRSQGSLARDSQKVLFLCVVPECWRVVRGQRLRNSVGVRVPHKLSVGMSVWQTETPLPLESGPFPFLPSYVPLFSASGTTERERMDRGHGAVLSGEGDSGGGRSGRDELLTPQSWLGLGVAPWVVLSRWDRTWVRLRMPGPGNKPGIGGEPRA